MFDYLSTLFSEPIAFFDQAIFRTLAVLIGLCCHEWGHAYVAYRCGDDTAKRAGRLTLNPLRHLDPVGTILMFFAGFGYAKPVPVNPYNFRGDRNRDDFLVSIAGITVNLILFVLFTYLAVLCSAFMWDGRFVAYNGLSKVVSYEYNAVWSVIAGSAKQDFGAVIARGWLVPFVFLASIGMCILFNLGSNYFFGEISYITKALSAVLQLAVTMDYSIFLWHSYNEQLEHTTDHKEAMAVAIHETFASVLGSSITTVAGFIALCFMSFTLGRDLGIVMAKGVVLGVIGCVTILPSMILLLDKPLQKTRHKSLIPDMSGFSKGVCKRFPVFLVIFALLIGPAYYGYSKTNSEVYYDMGQCLPEDIDYVIANSKLAEDFDISSTHMLLIDADLPTRDVRDMIDEMEQVDGVKYVLGLESVVGPLVPEEILPDSVRSMLENDQWELLLINSEYKVASDAVSDQLDSLNAILKKYDDTGMLIGEAPCMKDMIDTTDHDFQVVNAVSIVAIFVIIALVEKSLSLPFVLIAVIELAVFINLGLPHYLGQSLPFIAPICISTIQLGATVDYAILMTTRYKSERLNGNDRKAAVYTALRTSAPSVIVSGLGLFAATFGVAVYSNIDIVASMCMLMARGAIISVLLVLLVLPALLILCDGVICKTTHGMRHLSGMKKQEVSL